MTNDELRLLMPIKAVPYEHQVRAFAFVSNLFGAFGTRLYSRGAALLMDMGTGKTLTSIAISGMLYQFEMAERVLIVAPLSILGVWEEEFERFADFPYSLTVLKGSCTQKKQQLQEVPEKGLQVVVVNYESAWRMEKDLREYDADLIIADEGHKIKSINTSISKCMHTLGDQARFRLLLTGTLITNKELDVYSEYRFVNSSIFGFSFYSFRNKYFDMVGYGNHTAVFRKTMLGEFLRKMHSVAFRVTKAECLDLPAVTDEVRTVELEPKVMRLYQSVEKESVSQMAAGEVTTLNVLTRLLRLSQITGGHLVDEDGNVSAVSSAKLEALSDIVDSAMNEGRKVVVMARFIPELNDIQKMLEQKKIGYALIRGDVKDRSEEIRRFQNDEDCRVFVGQIAAAGMGITLTAASTMVFYSLDYSMSNFEQAKARIHRVSQKENCQYIYLIARDTVDGKVLRSLRNKVNLAKLLVDDYRKGKNPFRD